MKKTWFMVCYFNKLIKLKNTLINQVNESDTLSKIKIGVRLKNCFQ